MKVLATDGNARLLDDGERWRVEVRRDRWRPILRTAHRDRLLDVIQHDGGVSPEKVWITSNRLRSEALGLPTYHPGSVRRPASLSLAAE